MTVISTLIQACTHLLPACLPTGAGGRARPTLFPPFPGRLLFGPRLEFSFPLTQFQKDWATGSSTILAAPKPKGVGKGRGQRR